MEYAYKILDLLATAEVENIELAYQLLQPYVSEDALTEIYLMYFVTDDETLRQELRGLLEIYAPKQFFDFSSPSNHLQGRSVWSPNYMFRGNLNPYIETGVLEAKKVLYFFEHLLPIEEMHPSIKGLFLEHGTDQQIEKAIEASKKKNILILNACNLTKIPSIVLTFKGLRRLELLQNYIEELPEHFFERLPSLTTLLLKNNQLKTLPKGLNYLQKLQLLDLSDNELEALPNEIGALTHLRTLNVKNNRLKELPISLVNCQQLENLYLRGNKFNHIPKIILHFNLKQVSGIKGFDRAKTSTEFLKFLQALHKSSLSMVDKEKQFHLFTDHKKEIKENLGIKDLLACLSFQNEVVRSRALGYLLNWPGSTLVENPIKQGDEVLLIGDTNLKKKTIKTRLKKSGIAYTTQLTPSTTHVVLGIKPKNFEWVENQKITFLTEQDLNQFLNREDTPYLLEKEADTALNKENVKRLLLSKDEGSIELGVELLKTGGVPRDLMTELFFVAKTVTNKKIREQAKKMLKVNGSATVQKALADRSKLVSTAHNAEKNVRKNLIKLAKLSTEINWTRMGWYLYQNFGNGLRYTFDYEPQGSALRYEIIRKLTQDNSLNFYQAYASYMPLYDYFGYAYYEKTEFPIEILEQTNLKKLNCAGCRIGSIPEEIAQLKALEVLDLSANFLKELPKSFNELKALRVVDLSDNELVEFPMVLLEMPWLEKIVLSKNRKGPEEFPLQLPPTLKDKLKHTQVVGIE
ncbi:leucine-rich repeat domain-containing protein [Aureispira sp. CCB-QB1]|uniref:leucine-rich repeat domain-containing protein n=1 Tax=Aureispira sp. CCB-QB1 TaxID=1313421 RepID=UPI0006979286|nr:leucine-rich repeat domain-containing protein [Aureispira sp. CCB-QB1]